MKIKIGKGITFFAGRHELGFALVPTWFYFERDPGYFLITVFGLEVVYNRSRRQRKLKEWFARILDKYTPLCWADLVMYFRHGKSLRKIIVSKDHKGCQAESLNGGSCFCGKYQNGKIQPPSDKVKSEPVTIDEDLPF